jgi:hypothetical protein
MKKKKKKFISGHKCLDARARVAGRGDKTNSRDAIDHVISPSGKKRGVKAR